MNIMTIDSVISKIQSNDNVIAKGTCVHFDIHDLIIDKHAIKPKWCYEVFKHTPTGARILLVDNPFDYTYCTQVYLSLPNHEYSKFIWLCEDIDNKFEEAIDLLECVDSDEEYEEEYDDTFDDRYDSPIKYRDIYYSFDIDCFDDHGIERLQTL